MRSDAMDVAIEQGQQHGEPAENDPRLGVLNNPQLRDLIGEFVLRKVEKQIILDSGASLGSIKYVCLESKTSLEWTMEETIGKKDETGNQKKVVDVAVTSATPVLTIGATKEYQAVFPNIPHNAGIVGVDNRVKTHTVHVNEDNGDLVYVAQTSFWDEEAGRNEFQYYLRYFDASKAHELPPVKLPIDAYFYWPRICVAWACKAVYIQSENTIGWVDFSCDVPVLRSVFEKPDRPLPAGTLRCNDPNKYVRLLLKDHLLVAVRRGGVVDCFLVGIDKAPVFDREIVLKVPGMECNNEKKKLSVGDRIVIGGSRTCRTLPLSLVLGATISLKEDKPTGFLNNPESVLMRAPLLASGASEDSGNTLWSALSDYSGNLTVSSTSPGGIYVARGTGGLVRLPYVLDEGPSILFRPKENPRYSNRHGVEDNVTEVCLLHNIPIVLANEPQRSDGAEVYIHTTYRLIRITHGNSDENRKHQHYLRGFERPTFL